MPEPAHTADPAADDAPCRLVSVALRCFRMEAMVAFYQDAFGFAFEAVAVGGMDAQFGRLNGFTLKLVPLSDARERDEAPSHQLGFRVDDPEAVLALAEKYGGSAFGPERVQDGLRHLAVRDPDGNPVEVVGPAGTT